MKLFAKGLVVAGALFGASLAGVEAASAMPIAPYDGVSAPAAPIETIAWPCGPGWHPNPWGRCVPNWRRYGYGYGYRPYYRPYWGYRPYYRRHYYYRGW